MSCKKVSYRKQIARQHSWSTLWDFPHILFDHHAKVGCCFRYCLRVCRSIKLGRRWTHSPWDVGTRLTRKTRYSATCVTMPNLAILCQATEKNDPYRPAFQGHSRSLEPTRNDQLSVVTSY